MKIVKKLPAHLLHTEQAGGKYANIYAAMAKLGIGAAVEVEKADVGATAFKQLVDACHSCVGSWHHRKDATERFSSRRDNETETVFIVRRS